MSFFCVCEGKHTVLSVGGSDLVKPPSEETRNGKTNSDPVPVALTRYLGRGNCSLWERIFLTKVKWFSSAASMQQNANFITLVFLRTPFKCSQVSWPLLDIGELISTELFKLPAIKPYRLIACRRWVAAAPLRAAPSGAIFMRAARTLRQVAPCPAGLAR